MGDRVSVIGGGERPRSGIPFWAKLALMVLFGGIIGLSLFTVSYAEATSYLSDDPDACRNCHVMNDVHDAWARGPHHAVATCNDCHIPHTFPDKYVVKALNGWNHSAGLHAGELPRADPDHARSTRPWPWTTACTATATSSR